MQDINKPCSDEVFKSTCLEIKKHNLHEDLEDLILKNVQDELLNVVVPTFWSYFDKTKCTTNFEGFRKFTDGIFYLAKQLRLFMVHVRPIEKLRIIAGYKRNLYGYEDIEISFHVILKAALLSKLPKDHDTVTSYFYKHSFSSFVNQNSNVSPSKYESKICPILHSQHRYMFSRYKLFYILFSCYSVYAKSQWLARPFGNF